MAKNRSRGGRDDLSPIANPRLLRPLSPSVSPSNYTTLLDVQDNRTFYPEEFRPALDIDGRPHTFQYPSPKKTRLNKDRFAGLRKLSSRVQFANSENVLICVRRKRRKEVLHALKKTGRGGQKRRRRTRYSSISC